MALTADGVGVLFGYPQSGRTQQLVRPPGGPAGSPQALPTGWGTLSSVPVVGAFDDGSLLLVDGVSASIAFRPAGAAATIGTPQSLSSANATVTKIAPLSSGAALIGFGSTGVSTQTIQVAARSAGAGGSVDLGNLAAFTAGRMVGIAVDPDGGAVVVYQPSGTNTLAQAVRAPGDQSFGSPITIPAPGLYAPQLATTPTGYAVLAWLGGPGGTTGYGTQITVALRAPGEAFAAPQVIANEPAGEPIYIGVGVATTGDAIIGWTGGVAYSSCIPAADNDFGAFYATSHGGTWSGATSLGGNAWPNNSGFDALAVRGDHVAVAYFTQTDNGARCETPADNSRESFVRLGTAGPNGITLDGSVSMVTELQTPQGAYYSAGFSALAVSANGAALYAFYQYGPSGPTTAVRAFEDASAASTTIASTSTTGTTTTVTTTSTTTTTLTKKACRASCKRSRAACRRACVEVPKGKERAQCRKSCTRRGKQCGQASACQVPEA